MLCREQNLILTQRSALDKQKLVFSRFTKYSQK